MIGIEFSRSSSSAYPRAVALARQAPSYTTLGHVTHHAIYPATRQGLRAALEVWAIVQSWKTSRLLVNGEPILPHERYPMVEVLHCAARAAEFDAPARYCRSQEPPDTDRPPVPCRHWMSRWAYLLDRSDWSSFARTDALRALLMEFTVTRCPFLNVRDLDRDLMQWRPLIGNGVDIDQLLNDIFRDDAA